MRILKNKIQSLENQIETIKSKITNSDIQVSSDYNSNIKLDETIFYEFSFEEMSKLTGVLILRNEIHSINDQNSFEILMECLFPRGLVIRVKTFIEGNLIENYDAQIIEGPTIIKFDQKSLKSLKRQVKDILSEFNTTKGPLFILFQEIVKICEKID